MTETYGEIVGTATPPDAYAVNGAITRDCPNCGAPAGAKCTYSLIGGFARRTRHVPCIGRLAGRAD